MAITLKAARVNKNMTQSVAAERLGVSVDKLKNWEQGRSYPNALDIRDIENLYGVKFEDLIFCSKNTL